MLPGSSPPGSSGETGGWGGGGMTGWGGGGGEHMGGEREGRGEKGGEWSCHL